MTNPSAVVGPTPILAPDGSVRDIPNEYLSAALKAGGRRVAKMLDPQGILRWIPQDLVEAATKAGGQLVPDAPSLTNPITDPAKAAAEQKLVQMTNPSAAWHPGGSMHVDEAGYAEAMAKQGTPVPQLSPLSKVFAATFAAQNGKKPLYQTLPQKPSPVEPHPDLANILHLPPTPIGEAEAQQIAGNPLTAPMATTLDKSADAVQAARSLGNVMASPQAPQLANQQASRLGGDLFDVGMSAGQYFIPEEALAEGAGGVGQLLKGFGAQIAASKIAQMAGASPFTQNIAGMAGMLGGAMLGGHAGEMPQGDDTPDFIRNENTTVWNGGDHIPVNFESPTDKAFHMLSVLPQFGESPDADIKGNAILSWLHSKFPGETHEQLGARYYEVMNRINTAAALHNPADGPLHISLNPDALLTAAPRATQLPLSASRGQTAPVPFESDKSPSQGQLTPAPTPATVATPTETGASVESPAVRKLREKIAAKRAAAVGAEAAPSFLKDAKPRFSYQSKNFQLQFDDPVAKALYTVAQSNKNATHDQTMAWLRTQLPGDTDSEIAERGRMLKERVKALAANADPDKPLRIPDRFGRAELHPQSPPVEPEATSPIERRVNGRLRRLVEVAKKEPDAPELIAELLHDPDLADLGVGDKRAAKNVASIHKGPVGAIDLNGLKGFNDYLGKDAGDLLLRHTALAAIQEGLLPFRTGGDEFAFFGDDPEALRSALDRVHQRLINSDTILPNEGPEGSVQMHGLPGIRYGIADTRAEADSIAGAKARTVVRGELPWDQIDPELSARIRQRGTLAEWRNPGQDSGEVLRESPGENISPYGRWAVRGQEDDRSTEAPQRSKVGKAGGGIVPRTATSSKPVAPLSSQTEAAINDLNAQSRHISELQNAIQRAPDNARADTWRRELEGARRTLEERLRQVLPNLREDQQKFVLQRLDEFHARLLQRGVVADALTRPETTPESLWNHVDKLGFDDRTRGNDIREGVGRRYESGLRRAKPNEVGRIPASAFVGHDPLDVMLRELNRLTNLRDSTTDKYKQAQYEARRSRLLGNYDKMAETRRWIDGQLADAEKQRQSLQTELDRVNARHAELRQKYGFHPTESQWSAVRKSLTPDELAEDDRNTKSATAAANDLSRLRRHASFLDSWRKQPVILDQPGGFAAKDVWNKRLLNYVSNGERPLHLEQRPEDVAAREANEDRTQSRALHQQAIRNNVSDYINEPYTGLREQLRASARFLRAARQAAPDVEMPFRSDELQSRINPEAPKPPEPKPPAPLTSQPPAPEPPKPEPPKAAPPTAPPAPPSDANEKAVAAETPGPKYIGSINVPIFTGGDEQLKNFIDSHATELENQKAATRTTMHDIKIAAQNLVDMGAVRLSQVPDLERGKFGDAAHLHAYAAIIKKAVLDAMETSDKAALSGSDLDHAEAVMRTKNAQALLLKLSDERSSLGQTFRSLREITDAWESKSLLEKAIKANGGRELTDKQIQSLTSIPKTDLQSATKFLRDLHKYTTADKLQAWFTASLLSSPRTVMAKAFGDLIMTGLDPINRVVRGGFDAARAKLDPNYKRQYFASEGGAVVHGWLHGFGEGLSKALFMLKNGFRDPNAEEVGRELQIPRYTLPGGGKNPMNWNARALEAITSMAQTINAQAEMEASALRDGLKKGLKGDELKAHQAKLLTESPSWLVDAGTPQNPAPAFQNATEGQLRLAAMKEGLKLGLKGDELKDHVERRLQEWPSFRSAAREFSLRQSFTNITEHLQAFNKFLDRPLAKEGPLASLRPFRYLVPFSTVPYNIIARGLEYSPAGFLRMTAQGFDPDVMSRATIGSATFASSMLLLHSLYLHANGYITGPAPETPADRAAWYAEGKQPWSIRIGNHWVSYERNFGVLGTSFATAAGLVARSTHEGAAPEPSWMERYVYDSAQYFNQMPMVEGMNTVTQAMADPTRFGQQLFASLGEGFVPFSSALRDAAHLQDPRLRDVGSIFQRVEAGLPWLDQSLPLKRDPLGRPIVQRGAGTDLLNEVLPSPVSSAAPTGKVDAEAARLGVYPGPSSSDMYFKGKLYRLNPQQAMAKQKLEGDAVRQLWGHFINAPGYDRLSDPEKVMVMKKMEKAARRVATKQFVAQQLKGGVLQSYESLQTPPPSGTTQ
jgi:GGDEF domain-containing protein